MLRVRKYSPFVALAFGLLTTFVWIALLIWLPVHFVMPTVVKVFSDIVW